MCAESQISALCIPVPHDRERMVAIFQAYFDESGKIDKPVVAFCGFVAPLSRVQVFENEWRGILRSYEMECLTMKRAFKAHTPLSRVIRKQSFAERIETLKPFADCVHRHFEYGIATAVDVGAYKQFSVAGKKKFGGSDNPHYVAFLTGMVAILKHLHGDDKISLICDDDEETAWNCYRLYRRVRKIHEGCQRTLVSLSFAEDKSFPALQAADFLSALTRMRARYLFANTPYDYAPLFDYLTTPKLPFKWGVLFFDKAKLDELEPLPTKRRK